MTEQRVAKRKAHTKSRKGCFQCKQKHTKVRVNIRSCCILPLANHNVLCNLPPPPQQMVPPAWFLDATSTMKPRGFSCRDLCLYTYHVS
jgi:hypothetical protein